MIYLIVQSDGNGGWVIVKTLTSPINVKGPVTGVTWGDIRVLTLDARRTDGFWTQNDVYQNNGDYTVFKETITTFDEPTLVVTNTYVFELMPLDQIRADLKNKVDNKRDSLRFESLTFQNKQYPIDSISRGNLLLMAASIIFDETVFPSNYTLDLVDGTSQVVDLPTFKALIQALNAHTYDLYQTARTIKANIDAATTYSDIRAAANWNGEAL